jgi:hypothetical protein
MLYHQCRCLGVLWLLAGAVPAVGWSRCAHLLLLCVVLSAALLQQQPLSPLLRFAKMTTTI